MNERVDPRLVRFCNVFASVSSLFAVGVGLFALVGWNLHIAALLTWGAQPAMAPNNAACMMLAGLSLWLQRERDYRPFISVSKLAAKALAAIVSLAGLLTLGEHLFRVDLGFDRLLLLRAPAGQIAAKNAVMSPITAGALLLISFALQGIDWRTRRKVWPAQFLCLGAAIVTLVGLWGLILGTTVTHTSVALPTVLNLSLLVSGFVCSRASWAAGGLLVHTSPGARFSRRVLPTALLVLGLLGWIASDPLLNRLSFNWIEVSALAIVGTALLAGFVVWIAFAIDLVDSERKKKTEEVLQLGQPQLDRLIEEMGEPETEARLWRWSKAAVVVAVLLTVLLSLLSLRGARQARKTDDWVAHTHEVMTMLESTLRHSLDVETGGRGFTETGSLPFLEPYESGREAVVQDMQALRLLLVTPDELQRLNVLEEQTKNQVKDVEKIVATRQSTGEIPTVGLFEQGKHDMDAVRTTVDQMEVAERELLAVRTQRARAAQHSSSVVIALGSLLGLIFLSIAGIMVKREIGISTGTRGQLKTLNADLERRVVERTEAVQQSLTASEQALKQLAEQKDSLRESEERFHIMANGIQQLAWMADADGSIFWYNQRWHDYTGTTLEETKGWTWEKIHHPVFLPDVLNRWREAITTGTPFDMEFPLRGADGRFRMFLTRVMPVRNPEGRVVRWLGTNTDISALKEAEEASRRARVEAEEANSAKSSFLANMSYEIRTPMNAIIGMTYLALRAGPPPEQRKYLSKISGAADSLLAILNDILDFSKIEAGKMELENIPFSLDEVLSNLHDIVIHAAKQKHIDIVFSTAQDVQPDLIGDPLRLGQILINLVNNAIKFTEAGQVAVEVEAEEATKNKTRLRFSVSDTGIGMSIEQVSKLFQSFSQADASNTRKFGGTGLGLAISKQLCDLMGGTLTVESELGKGTTFVLRAEFPVASEAVHVPVREESSVSKKRSILIVDDNQYDRQRLSGILDRNGFRADAVSSGEEALSELSRASDAGDPFELVLMDWRLPGINGIEAARQIQDSLDSANVPAILMVTAFDRKEVMGNESNPGLSGFLTKPVKESFLVDTIVDIFSRRVDSQFNRPAASLRQRTTDGTASLAGRRVLLVEDNELNRDLAGELLADLGISVIMAVNGREAVERVLKEPFELVLMDIQMPVMDGVEATRLIRADRRFSKLAIVAMTAHAMAGDYKKVWTPE